MHLLTQWHQQVDAGEVWLHFIALHSGQKENFTMVLKYSTKKQCDFMLSHEYHIHTSKLNDPSFINILKVIDFLWSPPEIAKTKSWTVCTLKV